MIPGIAYNVPDIDAVVKVIVKDRDSGEELSCIQSGFTNGKTVSQTGAKWATAIIAGLGLLIAAVLSTFVVVVSMQHVERVPPIASSWAENLAWSMGLIRVTFMQDIFRWYIQSTGGHPTTYFLGTTKQILVQRAMDYLDVSSIMGWIFFILNAAFSLILLLMIIVLICLAITSKNPDARFAPAKDDRASFQRKSSVKRKSYTDKGDNLASKEKDNVHNELFALGLAAQDHSNNWELEMYRLHNLSNGADDEDDEDKSSSSENHKSHDILTPSLNQSEKWIANEKERTLGEGSDSDDNKPNNNAGLDILVVFS
ncbi:hypothetical protein QCA50_018840 [Cerrena zonata]|uniref:TRP C-terminal domain-containing protein n=1 Tax=Cerrena zonata TaxID=2478898 RepID=A0AAW0FLN8_9APHY